MDAVTRGVIARGPAPVLFVVRDDPWVQSAPGFPCALCYWRDKVHAQPGHIAPRDRMRTQVGHAPIGQAKKARRDADRCVELWHPRSMSSRLQNQLGMSGSPDSMSTSSNATNHP